MQVVKGGGRGRWWLAAGCASMLLAPACADADRLVTRSGETLQGTIVQETPEAVIFNSLTFGPMTVSRDAIAELERTPVPATSSKPAEAGSPAEPVVSGQNAERDALDRVGDYLAKINPLKGWKSSLQAGFTARRGEDNDNTLNVRFRSEKRAQDGDEYLITGRYDYAEDVFENNTTQKTDQLLTAQFQYRHNLSSLFFLQSNTNYYRDVIKELYHEGTQTIGLGYRLKGERWGATITPAVGYRVRDLNHDWTGSPVVGAYQDFEFKLTRKMTLRENLAYLISTEDSSDYSLRWGAELSQKLSEVWSLALRYDYSYDAVVGFNASKLEQRWSVTLGVEF